MDDPEADLEDKIAVIIKETYAGGYEDEGRSEEAALEIMALIRATFSLPKVQ